jgi:hypothetical protein
MYNEYHKRINEYMSHIKSKMITFEVIKCCGYRSLVTVYKSQTLLDIYSNIYEHFTPSYITNVFFYTTEGEYIRIPISNQSVAGFVDGYVSSGKLVSCYDPTLPTIYRLFLEDDCTNQGNSYDPGTNVCSQCCNR